ncbi:hypothetical protein Thiowin_03341 [Thiorhodovibrio winogradskyi]|uniref:DUF4010 domain-containing protein n=1 Tax=Thiorhodovibrio winogradskyi TaxID=77007 RepID=A0ABZ0SB69_9GAMM|nr:DUF4010 domain-containing protein [Thiorhodovibrio winogradskyi]
MPAWRGREAPHALTAGILLAHATLIPRILVILAVLEPDLLGTLALPLGAILLGLLIPVALHGWRQRHAGNAEAVDLRNPLQLGLALRFGLLLAAILVLARWLVEQFGDTGVLLLAGLSGMVDLNAITLSLAKLHADDLAASAAALGVMVAMVTNSLFKTLVCITLGGWRLGWWVGVPMLLTTGLGLGVLELGLKPPSVGG